MNETIGRTREDTQSTSKNKRLSVFRTYNFLIPFVSRLSCSTTSSTSSGAESGSGSGSNPACTLEPTERKVRDIIGRLKGNIFCAKAYFKQIEIIFSLSYVGDRSSLENTVQQVSLPLESVLVDPLPKEVLPLAEARKIDLEMAVIMQVNICFCINE